MSELRVATVSDEAGTGPAALTKQWAAKAQANFNGQGTAAIRDGENVSSLTDNGTGLFVVSFTNSFANTTYTAISNCCANFGVGAGMSMIASGAGSAEVAPTVGAIAVSTLEPAVASRDLKYNMVTVHGDLA